ncbi:MULTISPECIES: glutamate racemase [unclassified Undibacterium]|uniref:glutamate racemase n=2 Tax=Pseudomonadota TaxID=1224 RepID=UPI002AC9C01F|nr:MULTISPECIES: glutamate racemase [unclassified Undibacterium]MEB0140931.1 glutamate racemase [Undibacterium sp. CCC2.1]MEB0173152.1 glutamate racemase [Undibacterium sp. CCC1.1]MEB0177874.1 glutamate racemase [Undibacterium sp. CCC3.4]MEB0216141.1 glutamate racemase [Undibacterium sp. 5I2]WPX42810.1 glutamate racemase [Undibacterium sp. CCC3.4]
MQQQPTAPVGIFDSGVGGLSVLQHVRSTLPYETLLYVADSAFAPYGEKTAAQITARCLLIAEFFQRHAIKALVVACNTATAAAITVLRQRYPDLIIVGIEPGLKPAALLSKNKRVGVLATSATLHSEKFKNLQQALLSSGVSFELRAGVGLVEMIEQDQLHTATTRALLSAHLAPLLAAGIDTLVLGCTHYPFATTLINDIIASQRYPALSLVDTGLAVALQLQRLLQQTGLAATKPPPTAPLRAYTSADCQAFEQALLRLLKIAAPEVRVAPLNLGMS